MIRVGPNRISGSTTRVRDPFFGNQLTEVREGDAASLRIDQITLAQQGIASRLVETNGVANLLIQGQSIDGGSETAVDRWELHGGTQELPLASQPHIAKDFTATNALNKIEEAISTSATSAPAVPNTDPTNVQRIWEARTRGKDTYRERLFLLSRTRSYSTAFQNKKKISALKTPAWTTSALQTAFTIPQAVIDRLPDTPGADATPDNTTWAWLLIDERQGYNRIGLQTEESMIWEFWYWENIFYLITT